MTSGTHYTCLCTTNFFKKNYFFGRHSLVELTGSVPSVPISKEIIMRIPTATSIVWVSVYIYVLIHYKFTVTACVSNAVLLTHFVCVKKKKLDRRHVFDYRQGVSFLFTFCPPAYLADLSYVWKGTNYFDLTIGRACLLCGDSQTVRTPTPFSFFVCTPP